VRELASGTLPPDKFRFYIEQNLQYLPEYARAMALGASRAEDLETMRAFAADLESVVSTEIPENKELLRRVCELGARDRRRRFARASRDQRGKMRHLLVS